MSIKDKAQPPWSVLFGLGTGFALAVFCVYRDLDPDVILFRALAGGAACGLALSVTRMLVRFFQT